MLKRSWVEVSFRVEFSCSSFGWGLVTLLAHLSCRHAVNDGKVISLLLADEREAVQKKTFTKWVNSHLARVSCRITDLYTDLRDGRMLIKLLEVLSGERLVSGTVRKWLCTIGQRMVLKNQIWTCVSWWVLQLMMDVFEKENLDKWDEHVRKSSRVPLWV